MRAVELRILAELRILREGEVALLTTYETLRGRGDHAVKSFVASLKTLDERVNRLENFLERVA